MKRFDTKIDPSETRIVGKNHSKREREPPTSDNHAANLRVLIRRNTTALLNRINNDRGFTAQTIYAKFLSLY